VEVINANSTDLNHKKQKNKNRSIASAGQQRRDRVAEDRPQKNPQEQAAPVGDT